MSDAQKTIDSTFLAPYSRKWVALSPDYTQVVASGDTLEETDAQIQEHEKHQVVFYKVPPADSYYIPTIV